MALFRPNNHRVPMDPKVERPTTPPPQFTPNKAQAMQVDIYDDDDEDYNYGDMPMYGYNGGYGNSNKGKGKHKGENKGKGGNTKAVDPGAIKPCLYRYVYIWPRGRRQQPYWMYVTYIGRESVAGWRYNGRYWVYYSTDLRSIESFYCY